MLSFLAIKIPAKLSYYHRQKKKLKKNPYYFGANAGTKSQLLHSMFGLQIVSQIFGGKFLPGPANLRK